MLKRWISFLIILAFAVALVPLNAGIALAEEETQALPVEDEACEPAEEAVEELDEFMIGLDGDEEPDAPAPDGGEVVFDAPAPDEGPTEVAAPLSDGGEDAAMDELMQMTGIEWGDEGDQPMAVNHSVKITQSGGTVTIKGSVPSQYLLGGVIVDRTWVAQKIFGTSVNYSFNINNGKFATGYHTVVVGIYKKNADGTAGDVAQVLEKKYVTANTITDKPTCKGSYDVNSTSFNIYPFPDFWLGYNGKRLYLEYSADNGKTWKRSGYMVVSTKGSATCYTISGLQPNTTYKTRLRFGEYVTYSKDYDGDGKSYFFGGPALYSNTIKTGMATAPVIKSVKAKAVKVKKHKMKHAGYYSYVGGTLFWHGKWTERWYTCNIKVTVKLKKKPGTNGIFISVPGTGTWSSTKWVPGNKLTYTATFTPTVNYFSKKPKGTKWTVKVYSGQNSEWGGYSPTWSKVKKLK